MQSAEYEKLDAIDGIHWFYSGKRELVRYWMERYLTLESEDLAIDAGTGTGRWLVELGGRCKLLGLDDHDESLTIAKPRLEALGGRVLKTGLDKVDLPANCASVITLLDVLEHLDDDAEALNEMIRLVKPGGLILITVPALRLLWSDWDVALHHRRRYHRRELLELVSRREVDVLRCTYFNSIALPLILLVRWWRKVVPTKPGEARAEDKVPTPIVNNFLRWALVVPACWQWFHPPLGVSILAVLRKRGDAGA
jgi:SAM-dependent methyltransferase